jgi:hypothetical protein
LRLVFVSMDCVLVLVITFYYGLEVTQTSNGFNQSMDRMFHVKKEMVKDLHVQDWAPTIGWKLWWNSKNWTKKRKSI